MHRLAFLPLLLCTPFVWRFGRSLASRATRDPRLARVLAPLTGGAVWLLAIHSIGLASHSFHAGLWAGTLAIAALGLFSRDVTPPQGPLPSARPGLLFWLGLAASVALMLGPELRWTEHDECAPTQHIAMALQIQNGVYPPRHMTFPQFEYRYHYAIDLFGAAVSTILGRLDMVAAVHFLALLLWAYAFWLFWVIGERLVGGAAGGPLTALGVLFAGGAPFLCKDQTLLSRYLVSDCSPTGTWITPPVISDFLQHPWSLGIPLFAGVLLLLPARDEDVRNPWWWTLLSVLIALLSFSQVVLFLCIVPSVIAAGSFEGSRLSGPRAACFLLWGAAMALTARLLHGFFAQVLEPHGSGLVFKPFVLNAPFSGWASWHLQAFGLLLPLGLLGLRWFRGDRLFLALMAGGSLLVRNLFTYTYSWDIVKFTMVTLVVLALLSAAALSRAFESHKLRPLALTGFLITIFFGVAWPIPLALDLPGLLFQKKLPPPRSAQDMATIEWLRDHISEGEAVYRSDGADTYALLGGLPQPGWDGNVKGFGFSESLFAQRLKLLMSGAQSTPENFLDQGFAWLVLGPDDGPLSATVERWVKDGRARLAADYPPLKTYRVLAR